MYDINDNSPCIHLRTLKTENVVDCICSPSAQFGSLHHGIGGLKQLGQRALDMDVS